MSHDTHAAVVPPHIAATLPPYDLLRRVLASNLIGMPAGQPLIRAAWNAASAWPERVTRTYRYGPHESLRTAAGFPFYWIYAAEDVLTAVWEAQFCSNPATVPGRFTIQSGAEAGLIVTFASDQPLRLFDLSGRAASRLGIYDQLRIPDYEWCQWFGFLVDQILAEHQGRVHGFVYPSRRHPGALAYAISSRVRETLTRGLIVEKAQFKQSAEYAGLLGDPCYVPRDQL